MGDNTVIAIGERYMAMLYCWTFTFNAALLTAALVESSAICLILVAIHTLAISGSSCTCWWRKVAASLRAAILTSDRGPLSFFGQPHSCLTYSYLGQPVLSKKNKPLFRTLITYPHAIYIIISKAYIGVIFRSYKSCTYDCASVMIFSLKGHSLYFANMRLV